MDLELNLFEIFLFSIKTSNVFNDFIEDIRNTRDMKRITIFLDLIVLIDLSE